VHPTAFLGSLISRYPVSRPPCQASSAIPDAIQGDPEAVPPP
jgi:hypothetical protein